MDSRRGYGGPPLGGMFTRSGPPPTDVLVMLAVVFVTFSLQFFPGVSIVPALLRLTPAVWQLGFVWQVATYPFVGTGAANLWLVLELFILYLFSRDVFTQLGRRNYWKLLAWASVPAGILALLVDGAARLLGGGGLGAAPLVLMQGQWMLGAVIITAFATMNKNATILLMFILPIRAFYFVPLTILFAFLGFLNTRDLAGFLGISAAVGLTYAFLTPGGLKRMTRESWLRLQQVWIKQRMKRLRRRRGFTVVDGDRDEWLH